MTQEEINTRIRELNTRVKLLKRFITHEFSEIISRRFLEIEEEVENLKKEINTKLQRLEEKIIEIESRQEEEIELEKAKEKLRKKIDKKILEELE